MELLTVLFWVSVSLAVASFVIFAAFAKQRYVEVQKIIKNLPSGESRTKNPSMDTGVQGLPDADAVISAFAKLAEALSKAPMSVAALIAAMFFILIALGASFLSGAGEKKSAHTDKTSINTTVGRCVVGFFGDGDHQLPSKIDDSPAGCLDQLALKIRAESPSILAVVGRCDLREMTPQSSMKYGSNLSLAYQRALAVRQYLLEAKPGSWPAASKEIDELTTPLVGGAAHIGKNVTKALLREDRVVELSSFWVKSSTAR